MSTQTRQSDLWGKTFSIGDTEIIDNQGNIKTKQIKTGTLYVKFDVGGDLITANGTLATFKDRTVATLWDLQRSAENNLWRSVCWAPQVGLFVAVAQSGISNRVMTSPDDVTWTARTSAADNDWRSVCWSPQVSLFVSVALSGTGDRVMTSPDGITWTARTSAADNNWVSVCWSPQVSLFVAVALSGTGNRVMTSPNGVTWTARSSAADNDWLSVCCWAVVAVVAMQVVMAAVQHPSSASPTKPPDSQKNKEGWGLYDGRDEPRPAGGVPLPLDVRALRCSLFFFRFSFLTTAQVVLEGDALALDLNHLGSQSIRAHFPVAGSLEAYASGFAAAGLVVETQRVSDTFYETHLDGVWLSRRRWHGHGHERWRLVRTENLDSVPGAFKVVEDIEGRPEIVHWLNQQFSKTWGLEKFVTDIDTKLAVSDQFSFTRISIGGKYHLDQLLTSDGQSHRGPLIMAFTFRVDAEAVAFLRAYSNFRSKIRMYREDFKEAELEDKFASKLSADDLVSLKRKKSLLNFLWADVNNLLWDVPPNCYLKTLDEHLHYIGLSDQQEGCDRVGV
jgi:hypothetical protein